MLTRLLVSPALLASLLIGCDATAANDGSNDVSDRDPTEDTATEDGDGGDTAEGDTGGEDTGQDDPDDGDTGQGDTGQDDTAEEPHASLPSELLDLSEWKLTLPVPDAGPEDPLEIEQPELSEYSNEPWFRVSDDGAGVAFRANAGGTTTTGSHYPRSELREMTAGGSERASWSSTEGVHTMTITQAVTHLPDVKQHVVVGQIHDAEDDVVMIRLESERLYVEGGGEDLGVLDESYTLGEPFTVRIVATEGRIDIYHEDMQTPAVSVARAFSGGYFKAGVYTQSNPERGDAPEAYGENVIYALAVTHE